jgi:dUTP pyrophosphatase
MDNILNEMKEKILLLSDPDSGYTVEDFDREFKNKNYTENFEYDKFKFNFKNESNNPDPEYATAGSSGFDLRANLDSPVTIQPHSVKIIPTGLYFEIPENFEIQIRSRSSLSAKHGVAVLNSPGTIDSDYRGEIGVILINHSINDFIINNGDRIAQGVISNVIAKNLVNLIKVDNIDVNTERGTGGYGSTGVK